MIHLNAAPLRHNLSLGKTEFKTASTCKNSKEDYALYALSVVPVPPIQLGR
jgi:hypothetical protein